LKAPVSFKISLMKKEAVPFIINSISELHRLVSLPKPEHPLVSVIDLKDVIVNKDESKRSVIYNFYSICIKRNFKGKLKYGQQYYDFDEGLMTFFSPGQVISTDVEEDHVLNGWWLVVHPDFLRNHSLGKVIQNYGYFSYAVNEALHLSEKEEDMLTSIAQHIKQEYRSSTDKFSQDVILSQIELLLSYSNRFYDRQFMTRKQASNDLLVGLENLLKDYFDSEKVFELGLPTVHYISEQLNISSNYLSDMLRALTGQSTQQHIHHHLIEKAKKFLTGTSLSVSEIAYQLGFERPQSFNKLFKSKTQISPLEFRHSFN